MKLYTDGIGNWLGTQADAKREMGDGGYIFKIVPTDKPNLLRFLNDHDVRAEDESFGHGSQDEPTNLSAFDYPGGDTPLIAEREPQQLSEENLKKLTKWKIGEIARECDLADLTHAVAVFCSRIDEELNPLNFFCVMARCVSCNATEGQRRPNGRHLCGDCYEEHKQEEVKEK